MFLMLNVIFQSLIKVNQQFKISIENKTFSYTWDGRNPNGDYVPMGTYIVVFSGIKEDGQEWSQREYISVMH